MRLLPIELLDKRQDAALRKEGLRTFAHWSKRGLRIMAGAKAKAFDSKGRALFSEDQTWDVESSMSDDVFDDVFDKWDGDVWDLWS